MFEWEDREYVNPRKKVFKNMDTGEILNLELQDDPDNIKKESKTPLIAHNLKLAQQELKDELKDDINEDLQNIEKVLDNIKEEDFTNQITMTSSSYVFDGFLKKLRKISYFARKNN